MEREERRRNRSDDAERKVGECFASVGEVRLSQSREKLGRGLNIVALAGWVCLLGLVVSCVLFGIIGVRGFVRRALD